MTTIKVIKDSKNWLEIQKIREIVFQKEQGVAPEIEFDGYDETAQHLVAYLGESAVATCRIRILSEHQVKLERLAVLNSARRQGIGSRLMIEALEIARKQGFKEVIVHAQEYVQELYLKLGFKIVEEPFTEAGIPHVKMVKNLMS